MFTNPIYDEPRCKNSQCHGCYHHRAKMGMNGVTEDVVTVLCGGKEVNKSLAVHAALKEGLGVSDKIDEVLMLHTSEGMVFSGEGTLLPPKTMGSGTKIFSKGFWEISS